jgi:hypothetical protein
LCGGWEPDGLSLDPRAVTIGQALEIPSAAHPQQFHLDFHAEALDRAHSGVLALGGRLPDSARSWRVYSDPAGHQFCLVGA